MTTKPIPCPCGGADYAACCGRYHGGIAAPDAATLMRSRDSAFALGLEEYLLATWHPTTRPATFDLAADKAKWLGLEVKNHTEASADRATVEFVARNKVGGRAYRLHEISRKTVEKMSGLSRATIYRLIKSGKFPRPLSIGTGAVRWRQSDVIAWQHSLSPNL